MSHDPTRMPSSAFPRLSPDNHRITSPDDPLYNCIAWAAGDTTQWWEPGDYWPDPAWAGGYQAGDLIRMFEAVGFVICEPSDPTPGFEMIAVYARSGTMTHAARRLPSGKWTSKLGGQEDIEHDAADGIGGGAYGEVFAYMKRPLTAG